MTLSFDKFERYELPQVTLCNPNSRATEVDGKITITDAVGVLSNSKGMNLKLNFNAPHELSFDYYRHKSSDPIKQSFYDSIYEAIQTDRYIYLTDIGYFIISSVTDSDEDNIDKKSITFKSCEENELATAEGLFLKKGTYYLHTDNSDGLLDLFLPKTAGWTIGFIDPSLLTKPYYVEDTEVDNGYNFLYTTIQDMFECIVEPDIIKRTVSVYSRVYYAEHHLTDIHIAKYNLLKHKTVEENDEDKYTALNVQGKDESLEIRTVNPTGKNVIYNFESRYSWMSPALQDAVERWQEKCESVKDEYLTLQQGYYKASEIASNMQKDIDILKNELKLLEQSRDEILLTEDGEEKTTALTNVYTSISDKHAEIAEAEKEYIMYERLTLHNQYFLPISKINDMCALDITAKDINGNTIFTVELLNELMTHIKPTDYADEYMLVTESMTYPQKFEKAKELMDRAQLQLVKISSGKKTYSIDTKSFLFNKQFKHFSEQLCPGAIIYTETKTDLMEQLHLIGINISFDEKSAVLTLGNKYDRSDLKALYEDALGQNSKSFSELKYIASIIEDQQKQLDYQKNWVADLRTLTLDNVLTSEDQAIEINNRGLIGRKRQLNEDGTLKFDENGNPLFETEQVKLIYNNLVFTDDNWRTAKTAVGKIAIGYNDDGSVKYLYGINGQVLIGELILGNNLILTGTGAGIKIKDNSGRDTFYADDKGNLVLSGIIYADGGNIGGWDITKNGISKTTSNNFYNGLPAVYLNSPTTWGLDGNEASEVFVVQNIKTIDKHGNYTSDKKFVLKSDGSLYANEATITGNITANSGKIGDWHISEGDLYGTSGTNTFYISNNDNHNVWLGAYNGDSWPFWVGKDGVLHATGAYIDGEIIATTGNIGGWNIVPRTDGDGTRLQYKYGNSEFIIDPMGFCYEGDNKWYCIKLNNNFWVDWSGNLWANNATITGTINASYGKIGGWNISGNTLMVGNLSQETEVIIDPNYLRAHGDDAYWWDIVMCTQAWTAQWSSESDFNVKNTISEYDLKYEILFDALKPCRYKYNHGTSDRFHTGFIAQEVVEAIEGANLTTQDFAGVVHLEKPNKNNCEWLLRRDEFVALNTWQIQRCKKRIVDLENTVAELKTQIQTLTAG